MHVLGRAPATAGEARANGPRRRPQRVRRRLIGPLLPILVSVGSASLVASCAPATPGSLPATLTMADAQGGSVAMQNGQPVPSFDLQPGPRLDLSGSWRMQPANLDSDHSLTARSGSLAAITANAGGRQSPTFDDASWARVGVPGSFNPPPDRLTTGAWYRVRFSPPADWAGRAVTLKFGAVNYIADAWLNGTYLGYHEGGSTPFAFDVGDALRPGLVNTLAVRVDNPAWGSRLDIVPWGLADWWNYGGITQPVWLEAAPQLHLVRVDVTPHLDGADVSVTVHNRAAGTVDSSVRIGIFAAAVTDANLLNPDPRSLLPPSPPPQVRARLGETAAPGATPFASAVMTVPRLSSGETAVVSTSFLFGNADLWRPGHPALYVAEADLTAADGSVDEQLETFGLRRIQVDPSGPRLLLNGDPVMLAGVALHDEAPLTGATATAPGSGVGPAPAVAALLADLRRAAALHATLIRTGHTPAQPLLLMLADRLGLTIWEEIPLYHDTPLTFDLALGRGIAQQMLREMALRDMNHPSVLFHGLANESTGGDERTAALQTLRAIDRSIDGTRLTGQASYGFDPSDPSNAVLDVAGFTMYYGVFYGLDATKGTSAALEAAHAANPGKPILVLEFGRWADPPDGAAAQVRVYRATEAAIDPVRATLPGGYVAADVWWTLRDYPTMKPGIAVERFGMFDEAGAERPVAAVARAHWRAIPADPGTVPGPATGVAAVPPSRVTQPAASQGSIALYLAYAVVVIGAGLGLVLLVLARPWHGPRPAPRGRWPGPRPRARRSTAGEEPGR